MSFANTPEPPYLAVLFSSTLRADAAEYEENAARMLELVEGRPGFLGQESARGPDGLGITISYWRDEASIAAWKADLEHARAQARGKAEWYSAYRLRVARVERDAAMDPRA